VDEEHDALAGKAVAPLKMSVSHMQLDAGIRSRDHEGLGENPLSVGRRRYEPNDQQAGHNNKAAHGVSSPPDGY
jgi:hypothetical protein